MGRGSDPVPDSIRRLRERLQQFRGTHAKRPRLPDELWQAAVEQARQHGIYTVARTLRLDYANLQRRLDVAPLQKRFGGGGAKDAGVSAQQRRTVGRAFAATPPTFVESARSAGAVSDEYVIEFESGNGLRMRVRWRGTMPEWGSLLRS